MEIHIFFWPLPKLNSALYQSVDFITVLYVFWSVCVGISTS